MMPSKSQQLLDTIDAVLAECSKDPRRRAAAPRPLPQRPAWRPMWAQDSPGGDRYGFGDQESSAAS